MDTGFKSISYGSHLNKTFLLFGLLGPWENNIPLRNFHV